MNAITVNGNNVVEGVVYVLNGTNNTFGCVVSGTSPLNTSWELQTTRVETNRVGSNFSGILSANDEGNYTCSVVYTQGGLSDNATVMVKVFGEHMTVDSFAFA